MSKLNLAWILALGVLLLVLWVKYAEKPQIKPEGQIRPFNAILQDNSLIAISIMEFPTIQVLASKISDCESGDNPNAKNPNSTAYGLCQFIDSTWIYVQKKWDMKLDRKDEHDQLYACERLLREEGADKHWAESKNCWNK